MESLLKTIQYFVPLSPNDKDLISRLFHKKTFKKGDHLLQSGKICRYIIFIETGLVRHYISTDSGEQTNYFNKEGEFACDYLSFSEQVFVNVISQVISLYTDEPEVRYHKFLLNFPDLGQRIPQYHIASFVGVKPPSLSRIRRRMRDKH